MSTDIVSAKFLSNYFSSARRNFFHTSPLNFLAAGFMRVFCCQCTVRYFSNKIAHLVVFFVFSCRHLDVEFMMRDDEMKVTLEKNLLHLCTPLYYVDI